MAKDFFQSDEFKEILNSYEQEKEEGKSVYLDADDFADIADYYLSIDKSGKAMEAIEMGLSIHPEEEVLFIVKSATFIFQRKYDKAEAILAELDQDNPDVKYQLAQLQYANYGNVAEAERIWREWIQQDNGENPSEEQRRECYIHIISSFVELRGDAWDADGKGWDVEAVRRWIREYIDTFQPLGKYESDIQLADICRENELADLMCEVLTQVLEEQPYLHRGWSNLALAQFLMQNYEQALESCDFALAVDADDIETLLTKAHTLTALGEKSAAKPVFKEYLERGGEVVQIIPYVESLFHDGDKEEALYQLSWLSDFFEEQRADMEQEMARNAKKKLSAKKKREQEERCEDFYDLYVKVYTDIGDLYHRNEYFEESITANKRILEVYPRCSEAFFMLGINNLALERYEESSRNFAYALQWAEDQIMTGIDIALTFVLNNFDNFGLEVLNAVDQLASVSNSPFVKNIPAAKSLTYLKLGQTDQFLHYFKIACRKTPDLIEKVYDGYFPKNLPVSQWSDYAERETDLLMKKFSREDFHIAGFS